MATPKPKPRQIKFDDVTVSVLERAQPFSALIWAALTQSRQFFRSKVISSEAQTLFPSRPALPCHSGAHPGQNHLRTCQKYRIWMARFLWRTTTPFSARPPLMPDQPARISLLPLLFLVSPPEPPTMPCRSYLILLLIFPSHSAANLST